MIKDVVLDMGNVLLNYDPRIPLDAFCATEAEKEVIRRELFEGPEWILGDRGAIKDADRFELVRGRVPKAYWGALKKCCEQWHTYLEPIEGAREFCEYVKGQGYGVYILSNASDLFYEYFPKFLPLQFFDGVVVSCDIHRIKPEEEIYAYLLGRYRLTAAECLFVDDRPENVEAALAVGMRAHRFRNDFAYIRREILE